jgi:hypothetical protein
MKLPGEIYRPLSCCLYINLTVHSKVGAILLEPSLLISELADKISSIPELLNYNFYTVDCEFLTVVVKRRQL